MLTARQVQRIYEEGYSFSFMGKSPDERRGDSEPASLELIVYLDRIHSKEDFTITAFHECIHARDDIRNPETIKDHNEERDKRYCHRGRS